MWDLNERKHIYSSRIYSYRARSMTHSDITLYVESRCSSESECLHVSIDNSLIHGVSLGPGSLEFGNQLLILWTPEIFLY